MATVDRALGVLRLFAGDQSEWTVEDAARELGLSQSTAYQYFRSLVEGGFLSTYRTGRYVVGPAIIELDRQARRYDPLIQAAQVQMAALSAAAQDSDDVVLLCRLYRLTVMCVDQRSSVNASRNVSYERGRPMPLEKGAASKIILAHLPPRVLKKFYQRQHPEGRDPDWAAFRRPLREYRKAGVCVTHGELDPGRTGVSAPIFSEDEIVGSVGLVLTDRSLQENQVPQSILELVADAGRLITVALGSS